jgi:hypothetical protein
MGEGTRQREIAATIRQLEFASTHLEASVDGLMDALWTVISKKIPVRLIAPNTLLEILKNVSLNFPEGYRLKAGDDPSSVA